MNIDLKELRKLNDEALGGPMVQWPSQWQPWWADPRIRRSAVQALQDALSPDVMLTLLDRLEAAERELVRTHAALAREVVKKTPRVDAIATHDAHGILLPKPNIPQVTG